MFKSKLLMISALMLSASHQVFASDMFAKKEDGEMINRMVNAFLASERGVDYVPQEILHVDVTAESQRVEVGELLSLLTLEAKELKVSLAAGTDATIINMISQAVHLRSNIREILVTRTEIDQLEPLIRALTTARSEEQRDRALTIKHVRQVDVDPRIAALAAESYAEKMFLKSIVI